MEKWNFKTHEYEKYEVSNNWITPIYCEDMNRQVNCAKCGRKLKFGACYTSLTIHNEFGLGYGVCENCYQKEWEKKTMYEK